MGFIGGLGNELASSLERLEASDTPGFAFGKQLRPPRVRQMGMTPRGSRFRDRLLDWLVPGDCLACGSELTSGAAWCAECAVRLEPSPISEVHGVALLAPYRHVGAMREAIHRLKYQNRPDSARRLIAWAFAGLRPPGLATTRLIPVPLHPLRLIERGYNQAALLARALGQHWELPVIFGTLSRTISTGVQVERDRDERLANVRGAFSVARSCRATHPVWLVDDVVTTGATAASCRAALEAAGIQVNGVIALAHAQTPVRPNHSNSAA